MLVDAIQIVWKWTRKTSDFELHLEILSFFFFRIINRIGIYIFCALHSAFLFSNLALFSLLARDKKRKKKRKHVPYRLTTLLILVIVI